MSTSSGRLAKHYIGIYTLINLYKAHAYFRIQADQQIFYEYNFTSLYDWTVENEGDGIAYDGRLNCIALYEGAEISRVIPSTGYHTIGIQSGTRNLHTSI